MPRIDMYALLIFLVAFQTLVVEAALSGTCTGAGSACDSEPHADLCNNQGTGVCVCNINYEEFKEDCALIPCNGTTDVPTTICRGPNTACTKDTSKCSCLANFETVAATSDECTQITCTTGTASKCTGADANSYCLGTDCVCKKNFNGTNRADCETITCENDADCTDDNSACTGTGSARVCGCDTLHAAADTTTGACSTKKTCEVKTVTDDCGTNTVCEGSGSDLKCFCQSNYKASATGCVQKTCTGTETTNCDANSQCSSDKCICAANYVGNATATCNQLTCTGTETTNCVANSQCSSSNCVCADNFVVNGLICECPSTGFSLVGSVCKKACTATTECGTNGVCFSSSCECEPNYEGNAATACTQKACSGTNTTNCDAQSSCTSDKCVCTTAFDAASTLLACGGCEGILCNFSLLVASLLMVFFASKGLE